MKRTVIVVDDEPIIRMDLRQMLEGLGFEVAGDAGDGFDAVELCREKQPDIVLMDLEMPVFDGLSAAETIIEEDLAGCVVICTGFADEKFIEDAGRIGAAGYIVKPIEERTLRPALEVAWAQSLRLKKLREDTDALAEKLKEMKLVERAKAVLAKEKGIPEAEAYRTMQRSSMEKRIPLSQVAANVLRRAARADRVRTAKALIMKERGLSEQAAYRFIMAEAKRRGVTAEEIAEELLKKSGS